VYDSKTFSHIFDPELVEGEKMGKVYAEILKE